MGKKVKGCGFRVVVSNLVRKLSRFYVVLYIHLVEKKILRMMNSDELVRRVGLRSETFSRVLLLKIPFDLGNNRTKVVKREVSYPVMKTD